MDSTQTLPIAASLKFSLKNLFVQKIMFNFALAIEKIGSLAQLNRASDYGSEGYRFESYASHNRGCLTSFGGLY